jgi:hypothetical protein
LDKLKNHRRYGLELQNLYFNNTRLMTAYAWVKCEREEDRDCYSVLEAGSITGREGGLFGAEDRYVRLSLIRSQDDFDLMLHRLSKISGEEEAKPL